MSSSRKAYLLGLKAPQLLCPGLGKCCLSRLQSRLLALLLGKLLLPRPGSRKTKIRLQVLQVPHHPRILERVSLVNCKLVDRRCGWPSGKSHSRGLRICFNN